MNEALNFFFLAHLIIRIESPATTKKLKDEKKNWKIYGNAFFTMVTIMQVPQNKAKTIEKEMI